MIFCYNKFYIYLFYNYLVKNRIKNDNLNKDDLKYDIALLLSYYISIIQHEVRGYLLGVVKYEL
jgi:hypothetical protein